MESVHPSVRQEVVGCQNKAWKGYVLYYSLVEVMVSGMKCVQHNGNMISMSLNEYTFHRLRMDDNQLVREQPTENFVRNHRMNLIDIIRHFLL